MRICTELIFREVWKFLDSFNDNYHLEKDSILWNWGSGLVSYDGRITIYTRTPLSHWNIQVMLERINVNRLTYKCTMTVKLKPQ
jgi:hypothetical protein